MYAGFLRRLAALVLDRLVMAIPGAVVCCLAGLSLENAVFIGDLNSLMYLPHVLVLGIPWYILGFVLPWGYYVFFETRFGATPGKMLLGMAVVDYNNRKLSLRRATVRFLSRYLSGIFLGIGYFVALVSEQKQTVHDLLAGSVVVVK